MFIHIYCQQIIGRKLKLKSQRLRNTALYYSFTFSFLDFLEEVLCLRMTSSGSSSGSGSGSDRSLSPRRFFFFLLAFLLFSALRFFPEKTFFIFYKPLLICPVNFANKCDKRICFLKLKNHLDLIKESFSCNFIKLEINCSNSVIRKSWIDINTWINNVWKCELTSFLFLGRSAIVGVIVWFFVIVQDLWLWIFNLQ